MSGKLTLKCFFPPNIYTLRKVRVKNGNGDVYRIGFLETIVIDDAQDFLKFRLDYHRFKLPLNVNNGDAYAVVYLKYRQSFPHKYIDLFFRNLLYAEIVSKEEFENFENGHITSKTIEPYNLTLPKQASLAAMAMLSAGFIGTSIFLLHPHLSDRNFLFIMGVAGIVIISRILRLREEISNKNFWIRILVFAITSLVISFFLEIPEFIKVAFYLLALIVISLGGYEMLRRRKNKEISEG